MIKDLRQDFSKASDEVRNKLAIQFEPLVNKIVGQQYRILKADWDVLKSMAYEGLADAMNKYDPTRSKMTFTQYAAFAMLNSIRNSSSTELHVVAMTSYMQNKVRNGEIPGSTFETMSIDSCVRADTDERPSNEAQYGLFEQASFEDGDIIKTLCDDLKTNCNATDVYCFMHYYGLLDCPETPVKDLADTFGVTSGRISQRIKKVEKYIKSNEDLLDILRSLL